MAWLSENWIWVLFGGAFIAMHLFGHGCGGGHGGHGGHGDAKKAEAEKDEKYRIAGSAGARDAHHH